MFQTLNKNWLLLVLSAVLYATVSAVYLVMQPAGPRAVAFLGQLTIAAGICTVAAGVWRSARGKCWYLVLSGLALGALGIIFYAFVRFRIGILTVALLMILVASGLGILEWIAARTMRRSGGAVDVWFLGSAAAVSVAFVAAFGALGFRWIRLGPGSHLDLLLFGLYFAFAAISMIGLALRLHNLPGALLQSRPSHL